MARETWLGRAALESDRDDRIEGRDPLPPPHLPDRQAGDGGLQNAGTATTYNGALTYNHALPAVGAPRGVAIAAFGGKIRTPRFDSGGRILRYDAAMFARQYPVVVFFIQHIAYYRGLHSKFGEVAAHREFWRSTCDAHLKLAAVSWCNVFGSDSEDLHWKKTAAAEVADQAAQDFRQRMSAHTGFTSDTWQAYHKSMLDFRNKYVAHLDILTPFFQPVPNFDPAIQTAFAYQEWVRELTRPVLRNQPALRTQYAEWEREACSVLGLL
jgi:hypothetical protein